MLIELNQNDSEIRANLSLESLELEDLYQNPQNNDDFKYIITSKIKSSNSDKLIKIDAIMAQSVDLIKINTYFDALQVNFNPDTFLGIMQFVDAVILLKDKQVNQNTTIQPEENSSDENVELKQNSNLSSTTLEIVAKLNYFGLNLNANIDTTNKHLKKRLSQ